jgi:hypothetical protein
MQQGRESMVVIPTIQCGDEQPEVHPLRGGELDGERRRQRSIVRGRSTGTQTGP